MFYRCLHIIVCLTLSHFARAQYTTGAISGTIKTVSGEMIMGAAIRLTHTSTGFVYTTRSYYSGHYSFFNIDPGNSYTIEVSYPGYDKNTSRNIIVKLGEPVTVDIVLTQKQVSLKDVVVSATRRAHSADTWIDSEKMAMVPSSGNLHDHLRTIPQAKLPVGNEGAVSLAGQNNRFNAFYIDGAVSNDVFGLSASGTNGGQAGISPVSMESVHQLQVSISPVDASLGNFTGAAINAITRSGSNRQESSFYYFLSNGMLSGKTSSGAKEDAKKLYGFLLRTTGFRIQGAFSKNKLFYFIHLELQRNELPQPFDFTTYRGNTNNSNTLAILANSLRTNYQYEPGSFLDNTGTVNAARLVTRLDWNIDNRHKMALSYRHTNGTRDNTNMSNAAMINFGNNGYEIHTATRSLSLEIKSVTGNRSGNKCLLTYTRVNDNRYALGNPFPRVRINDGDGAIVFGTDISSTINRLQQENWSLLDKYTFVSGPHTIDIGAESDYTRIANAFVQNSFGNYSYSSLADFLTGDHPSYYQAGYAWPNHTQNNNSDPAAKFSTSKAALFLNDRIQLSSSLLFTAAARMDACWFLANPSADEYVTQVAIPRFAQYRDIGSVMQGKTPTVPFSLSPRISLRFSPRAGFRAEAGAGIFTGRIPLAWPAGAYQNNGSNTGGYAASLADLKKIRFRSDPYHPWRPEEIGAAANNIPLDLVSAKLNFPKMLRIWLSLSLPLGDDWLLTAETMRGKNLSNIFYTNINLLPPVAHAVGPDTRLVYTTENDARIPLEANGFNRFDHAILLHNFHGKMGSTNNYTLGIHKRTVNGLRFEATYHFNHTTAVNDGTSSVSMSQWRLTESVNGRNDIGVSSSDFSGGHRVYILIGKYINRRKNRQTGFSISYIGESGQLFSYVYGNASMTRDDGPVGYYDLMYIPTGPELAAMQFLPYVSSGATVTAQQQKDAFEKYIVTHPYLTDHRGGYAERNGSRTPFTHTLDLKVQQEWTIRLDKHSYRLDLSCELFNLSNLLNASWGKRYIITNDNFPLVDFAGYLSSTDLRPQYRFNPDNLEKNPWIESNSLSPVYSSRWVCRLGMRITL